MSPSSPIVYADGKTPSVTLLLALVNIIVYGLEIMVVPRPGE